MNKAVLVLNRMVTASGINKKVFFLSILRCFDKKSEPLRFECYVDSKKNGPEFLLSNLRCLDKKQSP